MVWASGFGFGLQGSCFGVGASGFELQGLGFRVRVSGFGSVFRFESYTGERVCWKGIVS